MQATIQYQRGRTTGAYGNGRPQAIETARLVARALRRRGYVVEVVVQQAGLFGGRND